MKILRIDMCALTASLEYFPEAWTIVGGRGLTAKILSAEMPPDADPLGTDARLVLATGPLSGTIAPSFGRMSIGAKSPLTFGIKESNVGGPLAQKLDKLEIRAVIIQGAPMGQELHVVKISKDGVSFEDADAYRGMGNYALVEALHEKHGKLVSTMSVGVVGERKQKSASIALTDKDGRPSRHAARGGLGAVMGAKGLKAILVDDAGTSTVAPLQKKVFQDILSKWPELLAAEPSVQRMSKTGTPGILGTLTRIGSAPSKNYSGEPVEGVEDLFGENIEAEGKRRGGKMDACMPGCLVKCSVIYHDSAGKHVTSSLEYETLALMGANLGVADPDAVARFDRKCDDLGVDSIEIGSALGVAASVGKFAMGDVVAVNAILEEIEQGGELGMTIADGVVNTAKSLGVERVPAFKGQAMPAHDPRVGKPTGVTYHTSPMGADHTAGLKYEMDDASAVEQSLREQILNATLDSLGLCQFAVTEDRKVLMSFVRDLLNACYELDVTQDDIIDIGRETLRTELAFNKRAEFSSMHGPAPEFVRAEAAPRMGATFGVDQGEIDSIWDGLDTISVI
jgi:aldehyde:ferredoxin oxidoreductase